MKKLLASTFILTSLLLPGMSLAENTTDEPCSQPYYFQMSEADSKDLLRRLRKLEIGDTREKALRILGKPTFDNEMWTKAKKREFLGWSSSYYTKIYEKDLVNEICDGLVSVFFNDKGLLEEISVMVDPPHVRPELRGGKNIEYQKWDFPKHVKPCLDAMPDLGIPVGLDVMGATERGQSCLITISFKNDDAMEAFRVARMKEGLPLDSTTLIYEDGTTNEIPIELTVTR